MVKKDPLKSSWDAVYAMVDKASQLSLISASSQSGFIFRLDVHPSPENSEFFALNDSRTKFDKPVYSLVFKFAVLTPKVKRLPELNTMNNEGVVAPIKSKTSETFDRFRAEAVAQQSLYTRTFVPQGQPITLSVCDFSTFNAATAKRLMLRLQGIASPDAEVSNILDYMQKNVNGNDRLGVITMELANQSFEPLAKVQKIVPAFSEEYEYAVAQLLVQTVKAKMINIDLHSGNILASTIPSSEKTVLIDFGNTVELSELKHLEQKYGEREAHEIKAKFAYMARTSLEEAIDTIFYKGGTSLVPKDLYVDGVDKMLEILEFVAYVDCAFSIRRVKKDKKGKEFQTSFPQMIALIRYLNPSIRINHDWLGRDVPKLKSHIDSEKCARILNVFKGMTRSSKEPAAMMLYFSSHGMLNLNKTGTFDRSNYEPLMESVATSPQRSTPNRVNRTPPTVRITTPLPETDAVRGSQTKRQKVDRLSGQFALETTSGAAAN